MINLDIFLEQIETKDVADGNGAGVGTFTGIASTNTQDLAGDVIEAGAFGTVNAAQIPMLFAHRSDLVIGGWKTIEQNGDSLLVEGELNFDVEKGREAYSLLKRRHMNGLSVGFIIQPKGATWDDKTGTRRVTKAKLMEISIVPVPANTSARIKRVKSADGQQIDRDAFRTLLADYGFTDEEAGFIIAHGFDALATSLSASADNRDPVAAEVRGFLQALKGSHCHV